MSEQQDAGAGPGPADGEQRASKSLTTWFKGSRLTLKLPALDEAGSMRSIASPMRWSDTTKLLMGLAMLVTVFVLGFALRDLVAPTLLALILVLVLTPVANFVQRKTRWRWRAAVVVIYLVILLVGGLIVLAVGGRLLDAVVALADQVSAFIDAAIAPAAGGSASSPITVIFGNAVSVAAKLLTGATLVTVQLVGWAAYILAVAFFIMIERKPAESSDIARRLLGGFGSEIDQLREAFRRIWSTWIYGQVILSILTFVSYFIAMTLLGLQNSLGIAVVSMFGRFIPYIGATVTWCLVAISAYTQSPTPFGLTPVAYAALCLGVAIVVDQSFDQVVTPRLYGGAYKIPTALVLIGTFAAGTLMGFFGMFIAAPLMATVVMLGEYVMSRVIEVEPAGEPIGELRPPADAIHSLPPPE